MQSLTRSKRWQMVATAMVVIAAFAWMQWTALGDAAAASHKLAPPELQAAVWQKYSDDVAAMLQWYVGVIGALVGVTVIGQSATDIASRGATSGNSPEAVRADQLAATRRQVAKSNAMVENLSGSEEVG